jgi:hypothetical protein
LFALEARSQEPEARSQEQEARSREQEARSQNFHMRRLCCFEADGFDQVVQGSCNITIQVVEIAESSPEESRYYQVLAQDLGYGQTEAFMNSLEEVSHALDSYAWAILASGS